MNLIGQFPTSPLLGAVLLGDPAVVQALLAAGADVHEKNQDDLTALHWAVVAHHADVARALLAGGADVNLLYAATIDFGDADTVTALLGAGADANVKNKEGKTAWAKAGEYPYIRAALEKAGAKQ